MSRSPRSPVDLHRKVFRGSAMVAAGRLTRNELRSGAWQRLFRDVYVCACVKVTHRVRAAAASWELLPDSIVTGRSAAVLWGVEAAADLDDVELTVPPGRKVSAARGVRVRRRVLAADDITVRRKVRVTTPAATALGLARDLPLEEAVVLLDQLIYRKVVDLATVGQAAAHASGPGSRQIRKAVDRADGLAQSPQETRLRLRLHASRLPRPVAQYEVRDARGFVACVDSPGPRRGSPSSTTGGGTGSRRTSRRTAAGSTG